MSLEVGFKRVVQSDILKASSVSVNNSTEAEDAPSVDRERFSFEDLKRKIGVDFITEPGTDPRSIFNWPDRSPKAIDKKKKRKKYNTKKVKSRAIKFIYVYKARINNTKDSSTLFKELINLVN